MYNIQKHVKHAIILISGICFFTFPANAQNSEWQSLGPDITEIYYFVQDTLNNYLYLVTGENAFNEETQFPRKIYKSTNQGQNWQEISRVTTRHIYDLTLN